MNQVEKELREFARGLTNEMFSGTVENMKIGRRYILEGQLIEVIDGKLYGSYGGWSNFWTWRKILKNGNLSKKTYCGYGGDSDTFIPATPEHLKRLKELKKEIG